MQHFTKSLLKKEESLGCKMPLLDHLVIKNITSNYPCRANTLQLTA